MRADRAVMEIARRQHGVVSSRQLAAAGLSRNAVAHRVASGWLVRLHREVFGVGPLQAPRARALAAVMAYGDGTLLSHFSAAALWGVTPERAGAVHVSVDRPGSHNRSGIRVHRTRLNSLDAARHEAIPVTSPARTLLDLAAIVPGRELDRAVEEAQISRLVSAHSLAEQFERYPATAASTPCDGPSAPSPASPARRRSGGCSS